MAQPTYSSAAGYIGENTFALVFDVPLDAANPPDTKAFNVQINGSGTTVSAVAVNGAANTVTLTFTANALTAGDIIEFSYGDPTAGNDVDAIQGTDGLDAATFSSSTIVFGGRPGPAAPATPTLYPGSDTGALGDGITGQPAPVITGSAAASATVKLYDTDGATLLGSTVADGSGNWTITSSTLAAGAHSLRVTQTDSDMNTSALSAGLALTIDTVAAAPTSLGLAAGSDSGLLGDGITNAATPTLVGQAEANAAVRLYDTDGITQIGSATADGSGNWSIKSGNLVAGAHTLTARQTDVAGNVSALSNGFAYTLDTIGPTGLALSAATVGLAGATSGAAIATVSALDATAITYGFAVGNGTIDADNAKFTFDGNTLTAAQTLAAGAYHIYVKATDAAANDAFQIFTINVVDAPVVTSIERAGGAAATAPAAAASVAYTVEFNQGVTGVDAADFTLTSTGTASGTIAAVTGSGSAYDVTVDGLKGDGTLRLDLNGAGTGIANLDATAIGGGYAAGQVYTLDHTAPAAPGAFTMEPKSDSGVSNSDAITSITTPVFSGTGEANATVNLYDTDGVTPIGTTTADGSGNWMVESAPLATGGHTLSVRQVDAAGNVSVASGLAVQILGAAAPPAPPVLAAASDSGVPGDAITNVTTPTVTGTAAPFAAIELFDTDGVTLLGSASADAGGAWSITASTLSAGPHGLTVTQTDLAGNLSAASAALLLAIDTTAPEAAPAPVLATASDSGTVGDGVTDAANPVITGVAEAFATIRLLDTDGSTVLGTATADGKGDWRITSATLALGAHALTVTQTDPAGNSSGASAALNLTIVAAPTPPTTPPTTVDGVPVTQQPVTLPGGGSGTQTTVPIVGAGRVETTGNAGTADIPLATTGAGTGAGTLLLAQVGAGFGLTASGGASQPAGSSLEQLIASIKAVTLDHTAADQGHLTGNGQSFLALLPSDVPLLVQTVAPVTAAGTTGATLTLTGTSSAAQHTALVIDASGVGAGNTLALNAVDFAALVGAATVTGNTSGQILTGDSAAQRVTVADDLASAVFTGGGDDTLVVGATTAASVVPAAPVARAVEAARGTDGGVSAAIGMPGATLLHGGGGADTAVFSGALAAYTVDAHDGYVLVTSAAGAQTGVVNAETLQFADTNVAVENRAALTTLAGLYADVLGRQADVAGFEYWGTVQQSGASLGAIALSITASTESGTLGRSLTGDAAHDIGVLYEAIFHRTQDAGGAAYWLDAMQHGATLAQVADGFLQSTEIVGHAVAPTGWDFIV